MAPVILISIKLLAFGLASISCSQTLNRQKRVWIIDSFTIEEGHPGPFPYELGKILIEQSYQVAFKLYGQGADMEPKGLFSMNPETGTMIVHKPVDYEQYQNFMLRFEAIRKSDSKLDMKLGIDVTILDINDNPPVFGRDIYEVSIGESNRQGSYQITVIAVDKDKAGSLNSTFHYEIASAIPSTPNAEFFVDSHGSISFKGCLDYQTAEKYTLIVEAKDHGEVVSLSSSTTVLIHIQDGNNHLPTITGHTGTGRVMERETGASPLRIHVTDTDTKDTPAWRVKYTLEGDERGHFDIMTEPETNDGILTVVKALDYEHGSEIELTVIVQNEEPHFSCVVRERTASGLWMVDTTDVRSRHMTGENNAESGQPTSKKFIIQVEDANDPPALLDSVKDVMVMENTDIGQPLVKFTAIDPDSSHSNKILYVKGEDLDNWVSVDPYTGLVTTAKRLDRESPFVVNNVYTVIIHAVDNGEPPLTGTGTLRVHVIDQNDNRPQLYTRSLDMCVSQGPSRAHIKAFDRDQEPYGGPFQFELLGNVYGKWRMDPTHGVTVNLVKEPAVYSGTYIIQLKISDQQGHFSLSNISVSVCVCSLRGDCNQRRATATQMDHRTLCIIFASLCVLLLFLLLSISVSCGPEKHIIHLDQSSGDISHSNTENPGTDCEVPNTLLWKCDKNNQKSLNLYQTEGRYQSKWSQKALHQRFMNHNDVDHAEKYFVHDKKLVPHKKYTMTRKDSKKESRFETEAVLLNLLHQRLVSIETPGLELGDYDPHHYSEEGSDSAQEPDLEPITTPGTTFDLREFNNLGTRFNQLAFICTPSNAQD